MPSCAALAGFLVMLLAPAAVWSQQPNLSRALELERRGEYAAAIEAYREVLRQRPADLSALLGLERSLLPLNRSTELLPSIREALAAQPRSSAIYGLALRAWAAADQPDSVRSIAEQWSRMAPTEETPYREWGAAELSRQNFAGARTAYLKGRERLGRPDALAAELAQLALTEGRYAVALREWLLAIRRLPGYRLTALATLEHVPESARAGLLRLLAAETDLASRRLEAELRVRWGDPLGGVQVLLAGLPADPLPAAAALRGLLDQLRTLRGPDAQQAQGQVLEALAERSPSIMASRLRLQAAQAYSTAGDREAARRMLGTLIEPGDGSGAMPPAAATTLIEVLVNEGKLEEALQRLERSRATMPAEESEELRRKIARQWIRAGDLSRAESIVASDTSVEGLALSGRIRLYRGDIAGALERFKAAGPYTGDRVEATRRTALLALLQPLQVDSLPALGHALHQLERGDTTQASAKLEQLAAGLPAGHGGAELYLLAGRLLAAAGRQMEAERALRAAAVREAPATAPAAQLALAELLLSNRRPGEAVSLLEQLILTYPQSALVPQARRMLDRARGAVPQT